MNKIAAELASIGSKLTLIVEVLRDIRSILRESGGRYR